MPLRSDPLDKLAIPDGTTVEEHDLVTEGDVLIGGQSTVGFGVRGHHVLGGERVAFGGDIEAEGDCRLDMWCDVDGNVLVGRDAYLGERVHVGGQLMVSGDLDIGDDVDIDDGFEANGWIVIRNPMPTIVFLFVYLSQLLQIGEEDAADDIISELTDEAQRDHEPLCIPRNAHVSDDAWRVSTPATVGDDCRLHGNIRAVQLSLGADNDVFGSLRAREDIAIGHGTEIHGDVTTRNGTVQVAPDVHIWGDVSATDVELHEDAVIEGSIRARGEMTLVRDEQPVATGTENSQPDSDDDTDEPAASGDETHQPDRDEPRDEPDATESAADEPEDTDDRLPAEPPDAELSNAADETPTDPVSGPKGERVTADGD